MNILKGVQNYVNWLVQLKFSRICAKALNLFLQLCRSFEQECFTHKATCSFCSWRHGVGNLKKKILHLKWLNQEWCLILINFKFLLGNIFQNCMFSKKQNVFSSQCIFVWLQKSYFDPTLTTDDLEVNITYPFFLFTAMYPFIFKNIIVFPQHKS